MNSRLLNHSRQQSGPGVRVTARPTTDKETTAKKSSGRGGATRSTAKKAKKSKKATTKKVKKAKKPTPDSSSKKKAPKKKPTAKKAKTTAKKAVKKTVKKTVKKAAKKTPPKKVTTRKVSVSAAPKTPAKRRNPRLVQNILSLRPIERESHFEEIGDEELVNLFENSYPSELVNIFLGLKPSTCRRVFEIAIKHRKRAYLDVITLYYHRIYLVNPFPLDLRALNGEQVPNYYAILGVSKDATAGEIEVAAKLLLKAYQAESFPPSNRKVSDQRLEEIKDSFSQLKTTESRQVTDRRLPAIPYYYPRREPAWLELMPRFIP